MKLRNKAESQSKKKHPFPPSRPLAKTRKLLDTVRTLRTDCPWDRKQTHRTLIRYLLEESFETVDAIESGEDDKLREELGDVLLQVVLHSVIAEQRGAFSFEDVAHAITQKMIRRHPHIYDPSKFKSYRDLSKNWTKLKGEEKPDRLLLEGTPRAMPALQLAQRYGEVAASVGFDWQNAEQVWKKLDEELGELKAEIRRGAARKKEAALELGDVFFTLANLARHLKLDAEAAARAGARKFASRFETMEKSARAEGKRLTDRTSRELETAWEKAKKNPVKRRVR